MFLATGKFSLIFSFLEFLFATCPIHYGCREQIISFCTDTEWTPHVSDLWPKQNRTETFFFPSVVCERRSRFLQVNLFRSGDRWNGPQLTNNKSNYLNLLVAFFPSLVTHFFNNMKLWAIREFGFSTRIWFISSTEKFSSLASSIKTKKASKQEKKTTTKKPTKQSTNPSIILPALKILSLLDHTDINKTAWHKLYR